MSASRDPPTTADAVADDTRAHNCAFAPMVAAELTRTVDGHMPVDINATSFTLGFRLGAACRFPIAGR